MEREGGGRGLRAKWGQDEVGTERPKGRDEGGEEAAYELGNGVWGSGRG